MKSLLLMFYSIHPSRCGRRIDTAWVARVLRRCSQMIMPFTEINFSGRSNSVVTNIKTTDSQIARIVRFVGCRCMIMSLNVTAFLQTYLFLVHLFLCERKTFPIQWRQLVSCDWLWHSHGSFIQSRFDLKIICNYPPKGKGIVVDIYRTWGG